MTRILQRATNGSTMVQLRDAIFYTVFLYNAFWSSGGFMAASSAVEDIVPGAAVLLENAKRTSVLRLSGLTITLVPQDVWCDLCCHRPPSAAALLPPRTRAHTATHQPRSIGATLTRLDLGYNKLVTLPPAIASLTGAACGVAGGARDGGEP